MDHGTVRLSLHPSDLLRYYLSELKLEAVTMTSSLFWTKTGIFLQPGDFNSLCNNLRVSVETHRALEELALYWGGGRSLRSSRHSSQTE